MRMKPPHPRPLPPGEREIKRNISSEMKRDILTPEQKEACGLDDRPVWRRKRVAMAPVARMLRGRFGGLKIMAAELGISRPHLSEALLNRPGRGGKVRKKVAAVMTAEELAAAGWNADGTLIEKRRPMTSAQIKARVRRAMKK